MKSHFFAGILQFLFWTSAVPILYTYIGYPVWIYFKSCVRPRPWRQAAIVPSVSVILAIHNGGAFVKAQLDNLSSINYPYNNISFIIISDGSTDSTNQVLEAVRDRRFTFIILDSHRGKAAALNAGIEKASGEFLFFVDVRPKFEPNALRLLLSNFADRNVGCATGELILCRDNYDPTMKAVTGFYWRYEQWIRLAEATVDSPVGIYGGFYVIRRELAKTFPEGIINDDMYQALSIVRQGYRAVYDARVQVYDTWPPSSGGEFTRKVRTLAGNFQLVQLAPWILSGENRLRFELISHKLLRLIVPALLMALLVSSALLGTRSHFYALAFTVQLLLYGTALLGNVGKSPILVSITGAARSFCMLNAAIIVGFYKFISTKKPLWEIWTPTASSVRLCNEDETSQFASEYRTKP